MQSIRKVSPGGVQYLDAVFDDRDGQSSWSRHCEYYGLPAVKVIRYPDQALVEYDLIFDPFLLADSGVEALEKIFVTSSDDESASWNAESGYITGITNSRADEVLEKLLEFLANPAYRRSEPDRKWVGG